MFLDHNHSGLDRLLGEGLSGCTTMKALLDGLNPLPVDVCEACQAIHCSQVDVVRHFATGVGSSVEGFVRPSEVATEVAKA
jgi:hypothetical protein